jgi:hypothetical protein
MNDESDTFIQTRSARSAQRENGRLKLHSGSSGLHSESFGLHSESFGLHSGSFGLHSESFGLHSESFGLHSGSFGLHSESFGLHSGSFGVHYKNFGVRCKSFGGHCGRGGRPRAAVRADGFLPVESSFSSALTGVSESALPNPAHGQPCGIHALLRQSSTGQSVSRRRKGKKFPNVFMPQVAIILYFCTH